MLGTGWIARRGTDAAILLGDQRVIVQAFIRGVAPEFLAHTRMQQFGKGLRQTVGQRLQHNGAVVIVLFFKCFHPRINADACGDCKAADIVGDTACFGRDKVSQTIVRDIGRLFGLLAQVVPGDRHFVA